MGPTLLTKKKNESGRTSIVYKDLFLFFLNHHRYYYHYQSIVM